MNGPQRTAVFRKEFISYTLFGYKRNFSVPCLKLLTLGVGQDTDERTDRQLAVLSFARL